MDSKTRVIAFYLPQFHPIPENDMWWGKGFTEWTNVAKAKPLYRGHYQPHVPADLGFYDLRLPEVREEQAKMARQAGVEGFCYWHYWMGKGKMLLERPFMEVLESGKPDFPFCLGWANGDWSNRSWTKGKLFKEDTVLMEQYYSMEDYKKHFYFVLKAFKDKRYIRIDNKPLFYVHDPQKVPDMDKMIKLWNELAKENGLDGIFFVGRANSISYIKHNAKGKISHIVKPDIKTPWNYYKAVLDLGFDAVNSRGLDRASVLVGGNWSYVISKAFYKIFKVGLLRKYDHEKIVENMYVPEDSNENIFPTIVPNWDRSPCEGTMASINYNCTPEVFDKNVRLALDVIKDKPENRRILFIQAWNEWAEGNHIEPDLKYGHGYLDVLKKYFNKIRNNEYRRPGSSE